MDKISQLTKEMISFYKGDPKRIQHFLKVHSIAKLIGEGEHLDSETLYILEAAALVHDIGIRPSEKKYGRCDGKLQEQEGPAPAKELLTFLDFEAESIERICYLIAHHHTYTQVDGIDYRILLEADALVNIYEDNLPADAANSLAKTVFRTDTGIRIYEEMYHFM